jgi:hypothetical protein
MKNLGITDIHSKTSIIYIAELYFGRVNI